MKAVRLNQFNQPVELVELPQPTPGEGEVAVRVRAASINPIDRAIYLGYMASWYPAPINLGTDFSGEVVAVGPNVTHVAPGDAVYGLSLSRGTFAETVVVNAAGVARKPESLNDVEAAAIPLAGETAYQTLFNLGQLQRGQRVVIIGAAGGIGTFAVQLAHNAGAYVIGVERGDKADFVKGLGADVYVNSDTQRFEDVVGQVDLVLDLVGGEYTERAFSVIKRGGFYVSPAANLAENAGERHGITAVGTFTQPSVDELNTLAQAVDAGQLKVIVNRTFPQADVQDALFYSDPLGTPGKIVLSLN